MDSHPNTERPAAAGRSIEDRGICEPIDGRRLEDEESTNSSSVAASPRALSTGELSSPQAQSLTVWTYDDTAWADNLDAWNEQCGSTFWTQHAHNVKWSDVANNIFECKGSMCFKGSSNADTCSADCNGGGCTTNLDSFAPMMVYQAMLRAETIIAGGGVLAPLDVVHELEAVKKALATFSSNLDESTTAKAMVSAQISAVDTMAKSATRFTAAGFVPAFTRQFYNTRLVEYIDEVNQINRDMQRHADQADFNQHFLRTFRVAEESLNGEAGVTKTMEVQTHQSLTSSIVGMNTAVIGMRQTETLLEEAETAFEEALEAFRRSQRRGAILSLARSLVNPKKRWPSRPSTVINNFRNAGVKGAIVQSVQGLASAGETVVNVSVNVFNVAKGCRDLIQAEQNTHDAITDGLQMLAEDLDMMSELNKTSTMEDLQYATVELNSQLPGLGEGFWRQWVSNASLAFNEYLTGYNSAVNGAARSYIDRLNDQAAFGNDYTTQGYRFVEAVQQLTVFEAMNAANEATASAVEDAQKEITGNDDSRAAAQTILAIKMSTLGMQIETTIQQLCSSYAFQTTGLFDQCVNSPEANVLQQLCSAATEGKLDFKPLKIAPCAQRFASESAHFMNQLNRRHQNVRRVNEVVDRAMWGNDANARYENLYVNITLEPWTPPECPCSTSGNCKTVERLAICDEAVRDEPSNNVWEAPKDECLEDDDLRDPVDQPGAVCCKIKQEVRLCDGLQPPTDRPYILKETFDRFKETSVPSKWGELIFNVEPQHLQGVASLRPREEIFVRAAGVFLEGAKVESTQLLAARLTPVGEMSARIFDRSLADSDDCLQYRAADERNLCIFRNHSFLGAPSGQQATAMAEFVTEYTTPTPPSSFRGQPTCAPGQNQRLRDVFVQGDEPARLAPGHQWCVPSDTFANINRNFAIPDNPHFNSPSIFSSFQLSVNNAASHGKAKDDPARRLGVDLASTSKIHIGMWLHTRQRERDVPSCNIF